MTQTELEKRQERATRETFVIKRTDEGFRIYSPGNPTRNYLVAGTVDAPTCSCPDFEQHRDDPDWRCKHVLAVVAHVSHPNGRETGNGSEHADRGAPADTRTRTERSPVPANRPTGMLLKRSVSPDGRIDSLSIEFSCPLGREDSDAVVDQARRALELQSEIVEGFLANGGRGNGRSEGNGPGRDSAIEARMLRIGGLDTRYGRRLFVQVQVNGDMLKLFGSRKQLAEAIAAAGFPSRAERIEEGIRLDLPCRVTTKPSDDGRYENVDQVFPVPERRHDRRPGR